MKVVLSCCVVLLVILAGVPAQALEPLVLYDDFNEGPLDPAKWIWEPFEFGGADGEAVHLLLTDRLFVASRASGNTNSDSGGGGGGANLFFINPAAVTAIEATVRAVAAEAMGCTSNPTVGASLAELFGQFFNTGTPMPGSSVNDVMAFIAIVRFSNSTDPKIVLRVITTVFQCTVANCSDGIQLDFQDLGSIRVGEEARLRIQWDSDNDQFIFQRDDEPEVFFPYTVSDTAPPGNQYKNLLFNNFVPNCTTESSGGSMAVFFDDVFVNESAAP